MEPSVLGLGVVHLPVKVVEELVAQQMVFREVELSSSIPEGVVVSLSGEVKPLRMAKLITFKVEVTLTSQAMCEKADHLVECHTPINH